MCTLCRPQPNAPKPCQPVTVTPELVAAITKKQEEMARHASHVEQTRRQLYPPSVLELD